MTDETQITSLSANSPGIGDRWTSRKFFLALMALTCGSVGLFVGKFDPQNYLWLTGLVLGIHGATSTIDKKMNPDQQP
jgi:hypothetical protein